MDKNEIRYTQCYWHANGNLVCNQVNVPYEQNRHQKYVEFDNFSTPNQNYNPNGYRKNLQYYESANNYKCSVPCNNCNRPENNNYDWMSPQKTYDKKSYLLNTNISETNNNYFKSEY